MGDEVYDVCVIGGGSGGFGAAVSAARHGARTVLVEAGPGLGGTSTWAGVNNYEPVAGATGLPREVYERLRERPLSVCLQKRRASYHPDRPWGWYDRSDETDYRLSLSRKSGVPIVFEPDVMDAIMRETVEESGCELRLRTRFARVESDAKRLTAVQCEGPDGDARISAGVFIDATADIHLAREAGCASAVGLESKGAYDEPSAPEQGGLVLNNASLCYRVAPVPDGELVEIPPPPHGVDLDALRPVTSIRTYPNGDLNMNPLHLITGREAYELGAGAYAEAKRRTLAQWHVLQTRYGFEFERWKMTWVSPALGIRETHRLVGRYVLTEHDIDAGLDGQDHDDIVAIADHSIDFHGARPSREVPNGPYGVPFRCLQAREFDNLLVACRGASFSSIGASSCRLSRTMMVLGQAAGTAAALFGDNVSGAYAERLRQTLRADGVALDLASGYLEAMPVESNA